MPDMKLLKAENIYETFAPLHKFSMILGLNSFSIKRDGLGKFSGCLTSWNIGILTIITMWSIIVCINYASGVNLWEISQEYFTELYHDCSLILTILEIFMDIIIKWFTFFKKGTFARILNSIDEFDRELECFGFKINYCKHKRNLIIFLTIPCVLNFSILLCCVAYNEVSNVHDVSVFAVIHDIVMIQSVGCVVVQFGYFVKCITLRIHMLNKNLMIIQGNLSDHQIKDIQHTVALYDKLVSVTDDICSYYGLPVS